jgi:hypothetical protein
MESPSKRAPAVAIVGSRPGKIISTSSVPPVHNTPSASASAETTSNLHHQHQHQHQHHPPSSSQSKLSTSATSSALPLSKRSSSSASGVVGSAAATGLHATASSTNLPTSATTYAPSHILRVTFDEERADIWKRMKDDQIRYLNRVQIQDWLKYHGVWDESMQKTGVSELRDRLIRFKRSNKTSNSSATIARR